jgi:beta-glucanase (GH16 family)
MIERFQKYTDAKWYNFHKVLIFSMNLRRFSLSILMSLPLLTQAQIPTSGNELDYESTMDTGSIYNHLVWSDEFDGEGAIDSDKWFHQTLLPLGNSWFNGEIQHYTDRLENTFVEDGKLKIMARREDYTDQGVTKQYTSARLNSKFAFQYGRVVVRAKLPSGVGTWPAIWMLGKNINEDGAYWDNEGFGTTPWPACGEMDIMEHWGHNQNYVSSATHTSSSFGNTINVGGQFISTASTEFHNYTLEWSPEKLIFSVDDIVHFTYEPTIQNAETWPFDAAHYLLLNVAILPSIEPSFSNSAMEIDYIRVYQEGTVSTQELSQNPDNNVFPNPFVSEVTIEVDKINDQNVPVTIYNLEGQAVFNLRVDINDHKIALNQLDFLPKGLYIIRYELDGFPRFVRVSKL